MAINRKLCYEFELGLSVVHAPEGNMTADDVRVYGVRTICMYVGIHIWDYVRSL